MDGTVQHAGIYTLLQKEVIEPMMIAMNTKRVESRGDYSELQEVRHMVTGYKKPIQILAQLKSMVKL